MLGSPGAGPKPDFFAFFQYNFVPTGHVNSDINISARKFIQKTCGGYVKEAKNAETVNLGLDLGVGQAWKFRFQAMARVYKARIEAGSWAAQSD